MIEDILNCCCNVMIHSFKTNLERTGVQYVVPSLALQ